MITEAMGQAALVSASIWFVTTLLITFLFIDLKKCGKIISGIMFSIVVVFPALLSMFGIIAIILNAK